MKIAKYLILFTMFVLPIIAAAQAKKPTIMVIPGDTWCFKNGYMVETESQGSPMKYADYERAVQEDMNLVNVISKVGELMAEQGFPLKDLASTLRDIRQSEAEDQMTVSRESGAVLAESPLDMLLNRAKADILIEVVWNINTVGPRNSITYTLKGLDAYTNKQIAACQGTGEPSFSAEIPVLLQEAVINNMDNFVAQLQMHFDDLFENGREISLNVRVFDNGSGMCLEDEYDGEELATIIDDWMADNTVNHRYNLSTATESRMLFEQVRIPLYRKNGRPMDARSFVNQLRKYLADNYEITCKIVTKGLGRADLIIGEK